MQPPCRMPLCPHSCANACVISSSTRSPSPRGEVVGPSSPRSGRSAHAAVRPAQRSLARRMPFRHRSLLNGAAAAAGQLQDGREARGHPALHVVLATFALAEAPTSSESMLSAVLAGYEVGARIGIAMGGTPQGVRDIGTWGAVATAVATTHLLTDADAAAIARAIELAASSLLLSDARTIFGGYTGGHAYLGASISHGMVGTGGSGRSRSRPRRPRASSLLTRPPSGPACRPKAPADRSTTRSSAATSSCTPRARTCTASSTPSMTSGRPTRRGPSQRRAERFRVRTYAAASAFDTRARNELEARFSIPTAVALSLLHGRLDDDVLTDEEVASEPVRPGREGRRRARTGPRRRIPSRTPNHRRGPASRRSSTEGDEHPPRGDADGDASRGACSRRSHSTPRAHLAPTPSNPHSPGRVARPAHPSRARPPLQAGRASKARPAHDPGRGRSHMTDISMTRPRKPPGASCSTRRSSPSSPPSTHAGTP